MDGALNALWIILRVLIWVAGVAIIWVITWTALYFPVFKSYKFKIEKQKLDTERIKIVTERHVAENEVAEARDRRNDLIQKGDEAELKLRQLDKEIAAKEKALKKLNKEKANDDK